MKKILLIATGGTIASKNTKEGLVPATASVCDLTMNAPNMITPSSMYMAYATPSLVSR